MNEALLRRLRLARDCDQALREAGFDLPKEITADLDYTFDRGYFFTLMPDLGADVDRSCAAWGRMVAQLADGRYRADDDSGWGGWVADGAIEGLPARLWIPELTVPAEHVRAVIDTAVADYQRTVAAETALAARLPAGPVLELDRTRLEALAVVRDAPLQWRPPARLPGAAESDQGTWRRGDLVHARVSVPGEPTTIATLVNLDDPNAACRWLAVSRLTELDFARWNGDWLPRAGHGGLAVAAWCDRLTPLPGQLSNIVAAPATGHHELVQLRGSALASVPARVQYWWGVLDSPDGPRPHPPLSWAAQAQIVADLVGHERALMNDQLTATVAPNAPAAPCWDPDSARILVPPGVELDYRTQTHRLILDCQRETHHHIDEAVDRALSTERPTGPRPTPAARAARESRGRTRGR